MQHELEKMEKDAAEVAAERKALEDRRTDLMDRIAALRAGAANAAPVNNAGLYEVTKAVPNVLDVARIDHVTVQPVSS
jgi:phage shock protein A